MKLRLPLLAITLAVSLPAAPLAWKDHTYTARDQARTRVPAQVATLTLPEDPAQPAGATITLALLRLPARTRTPGTPVVYLHGGPGGAGAEHLDSPDFRALFSALQADRDVILYDQRGTGQSQPSLHPPRERPAADALATRENFLALLERHSTLVRDRLRQAGHDPHRYTVAESVADLAALHAALGSGRIQIFAHSFGTQLAQAYLRAHPATVERVVLVGARGMDTARKLPAEAEAFLAHVAELARADATVGPKFPDLMATLRRVLAQVDTTPLAVELEDEKKEKFTLRVGGYALRFILAKFYLHDPDSTRYLPKLLDEIDTGRRPWSLVFNLGQILRSPISCTWFTTDAASGVSPARAARIDDQARTALLADAMNFPFPDINRVWQMPDLGPAFRAPVQSAVPTLLVAGTLDGITPVAQSRAILGGFSQGRLLVVNHAGHNSQLRPAAVVAAIAGFLRGQPTPESVDSPAIAFLPLVASGR